ncbi:MAG: hypothetical protein ACLUZZ_02615 [Alistipes inops]
MKKYFLMFATFAAALTMMSCEKDKGNTGNGGNGGGETNPPTDELKLNLDEAVYYGEKIAADVGYYSMTSSGRHQQQAPLDMFASVVDPVSTPKLTAVRMTGTITELLNVFRGFERLDTEGFYWKEGTAVLVTGGSINVHPSGGCTMEVNLTAGDDHRSQVQRLHLRRPEAGCPRTPIRPTPISPSTRESVCLPTSSSAK